MLLDTLLYMEIIQNNRYVMYLNLNKCNLSLSVKTSYFRQRHKLVHLIN